MRKISADRLLLLLVVALLVAPAVAAKRRPLPTYPQALRCAALTGAFLRQVEPLSDEARSRFDSALFWGLAASETARKAKLGAAHFERELESEMLAAQAQLHETDSAAAAELDACLKEVPPLDK